MIDSELIFSNTAIFKDKLRFRDTNIVIASTTRSRYIEK
jgi:hypothetical protein